jgi:hypothetical protein
MLILTAVNNPVYGNFKVRDRVKCLQEIHFIYGSIHLQGAGS